MFKNYIKIAFRYLRKNKGFSFINITGFAVGIACCLAILLFVKNELSYDKFNKNYDQIYRIHLSGKVNGNDLSMALSPAPLGAAIKHDLPEVLSYLCANSSSLPICRSVK